MSKNYHLRDRGPYLRSTSGTKSPTPFEFGRSVST